MLTCKQLSAHGYAPVQDLYSGVWANVSVLSLSESSNIAERMLTWVSTGKPRSAWQLSRHPHHLLATDHPHSRE